MATRYLPSIRVLGLALAALASPCPAPAQDQAALARFIHRSQLDNGLDMIVVENHAVPLTTLLVAARNGAPSRRTPPSSGWPTCTSTCCSARITAGPTPSGSK